MATAPTHPTFPSRPYSSTFQGKLPERSNGPAFTSSSHTANRDSARIERERQERERAQRDAGAPPPNLYNITDEQREEITEAVCALFSQWHAT